MININFIEKIPTLNNLESYYGQAYGSISNTDDEIYDTGLNAKSYSSLLNKFERHRKTSKILDGGCSFALFLKQATKRG